ncbi:S41 family peptidase [Sulfurimonas lithotrophica]|uniref:S41 family peptidase n=1 Tax=Sulfurimonas lithotrophica TaxID=2590022 RepID=A0A5P8NZ44_9BACT|nr:S41 family peptidase [Sulfurimonas lithotrophica]QFR48712.1 S41 family peptidase [Sulfurimonas lithotrophica]
MKNKKFMTIGFISVALAFLMMFSTTLFADSKSKEENKEASRLEALAKFTKVISIVEQYNVDKVSIEELMDKALAGMMQNLDAHSNYLIAKDYKRLKVQTDGEFGGLGITVGIRDGALTVIAPLEGTPADKAGLQAGDIILKINDESTLNMTIDEAVAIMRGKIGEPIDITIVREGESKPIEIKIVRGNITIQSVYTKTIDNNILYVRVTSFDKKVKQDVSKAIKKHEGKTKGIILDLRNNPGGLLDQAVGLVDLFVDNGVVVSQKGRKDSDKQVYRAKSSETISDVPLVVLVNGGSASASEIVSGALQDHKRAVVIGEKTFGKGSVQVVLPITDEEAIKLTIARYYLPSGRTIQAVGVTPDIEVFSGSVKTNENKFSIKEADLKKHLQEELEKVNTDDKEESKKKEEIDDKNIITQKMLNKDIQLKESVDIIKALIIMKG